MQLTAGRAMPGPLTGCGPPQLRLATNVAPGDGAFRSAQGWVVGEPGRMSRSGIFVLAQHAIGFVERDGDGLTDRTHRQLLAEIPFPPPNAPLRGSFLLARLISRSLHGAQWAIL